MTAVAPMTLDEAYGWVAAPARLLGTVESVMAAIGVPVSSGMAQLLVLMAGAVLAAAFWWRFAAKRGAPRGGRMILLVVALGLTLVAVAIVTFWAQFLMNPPPGEIFGSVVGDSANWALELRDNRDHKMAGGNLDSTNHSFTIYYKSGIGQVPGKVSASKPGCRGVEVPLTYMQVFGPEDVNLNLQCAPN